MRAYTLTLRSIIIIRTGALVRRYLLPLVISGVVAALLPASTAASAASSHPAASRGPAATIVRLPTGDSVRIGTAAGRPEVSVMAAERAGITGRFQTVSMGQDSYVFPAEARPFLGRLLDPSLFDVTTLARTEDAGRIPVTIETTNGAHVRVPGLVVTSRSNHITSGYLTARGSAALRSALVTAARTTLRPGGSVPASLFGGVRHVAITGAVAPPTPQFQMYTLKIKVLNAAGAPAPGGIIGVINTDDGRRYAGFAFYQNGAARISVPAGHYSALADVMSFDSRSFSFAERIVPIADFTVKGNDQTVTFDARTATGRIAVHTPRPATVTSLSVEFDRQASSVGSLSMSFGFDGGAVVRVAPTARARFGKLEMVTDWNLAGSVKHTRPYTYDLAFLDDGTISPNQTHTVAPFQLATVRARYYTDRQRGTESAFGRAPFYPFQFFIFVSGASLRAPLARTEYIYADASAGWVDFFVAVSTFRNPFGGFMEDGTNTYVPGERSAVDWQHGPLVPGTMVQTNGDGVGFVCPACRTVHKMSIALFPTTDTTPGHVGYVTATRHNPGMRFALYRGKKLLGHGDGAVVTVPPLTGGYRLHMTTNRAGDGARASTATTTDLTFRSSAGSGAPLPAGWTCPIRHPHVCSVLPLLHATVPLPTTMTDRLPVGTSSFVLTIAPVQGAKHARITSASFETRLPGGKFRPAAMQYLGDGRYRVTVVSPRSAIGKPVAIRVAGRDAAGDSITQTTRAAYFIGRH